MIYNIRKIFTILSVMVLGGALVYNCEPEPDSLGEQLFLDGAANGNESSYDLIAYNIKNNDSIRTDAFKLLDLISTSSTSSRAVLGAFNESQFGMQRASYFTQVRLATYNPDFGTNAVVDSVVLVVKPVYRADSLKATTTDENYIYPDGNVDAKKVVSTYPITKFGKAKKSLTLQVHEVADFMNGFNDIVYSDKNFATYTDVLGSKEITDGNVSSVAITKDSDNSALFTSASPAVRIKLSNTVFQSKIINKKGQPELNSVSNFIRHFRGLKVSVTNIDGYLFQIYPNDMELIMYYKNDLVDGNGVTTRPQTKYAFDLKAANMHSGYYEYNRAGASIQTYANGNTTTGDLKLYAQGMGGNSIGVKFPVATINKLKELYQTNKAAIISAKIRIYTDKSTWSNAYPKPSSSDFTIVKRDIDITDGKEKTTFTTDYTSLGAAFIPVRAYDVDKNPAYYDFTVTQSLKDIVESTINVDYSKRYFKIDLSQFLPNASQTLAGAAYTSRSYSPLRTVFVGSDPTNADNDTTVTPNEIKLRVTYGTKK